MTVVLPLVVVQFVEAFILPYIRAAQYISLRAKSLLSAGGTAFLYDRPKVRSNAEVTKSAHMSTLATTSASVVSSLPLTSRTTILTRSDLDLPLLTSLSPFPCQTLFQCLTLSPPLFHEWLQPPVWPGVVTHARGLMTYIISC
ncbi:hypothetical protein Pcinc_007165 [Petrolisthes cinctipes]|uniref:Uncharacterized protein n=1 Tax=Petrolisthes cinctipes TaxID=88211 RepID=A0AAE1GBE2_PETCI|nr:hypothetical protein Pcinc_007165 [Petrolisthes cinctipes]